MARQCTQPKRPRNAAWYKDKAMLAETQEAGQILDEEQLTFLIDPGVPDSQAVQTIIPNNAAFQTVDLDTYDSDYDDIVNAKAVLMANISNYGSGVISEVPHSKTYLNDMENQSVHAMQDFKQTPVVDAQQDLMFLSVIEQMINHVNNWEEANKEQNNESVTAELERYKERVKTFEQRLNINLSSQLSAEQAFCFTYIPNPTIESSNKPPVKVEVPSELPKKRTTPDACTKGEWGFEHTKAVFNNEIIPFLKSLKDIFNVFDKDLLNEIMEVQTVFDQMDVVVQQSLVDKQCLEIAKKELLLETLTTNHVSRCSS
ncbi:hypothetical protein Tco_0460841 [Tanacetum coccineum]